MPPFRTYVIGDIHGCEAQVRDLFEAFLDYNEDRPFGVVLLGDYVDRGANSRGVIELLMALEREMPEQMLCLRGNHEDMLIQALKGPLYEEYWLDNGGAATLESYGVERAIDIPETHRAWIAKRPFLYRDDLRLYVHAGISPGVPLDQQTRQSLLWIREEFLNSDLDHGLYVVHGHTPVAAGRPDQRRNRLNLDTGAVFGGPLTAAAFCNTITEPIAFITDDGTVTQLREEPVAPNA
jgi:serine/threonine protein phosphatase 1